MDYQKITLVGNATDDAQRRTSKEGNVAYTTFSVGVGDRKDQTTFFPVTVFGKQAEPVAQYVVKGRQVLVEGRVTVKDDRFNVVANRVVFGAGPTAPEDEE